MEDMGKRDRGESFLFTCTCVISYRDKANASNDARRQLFFPKRKRRAASGGTQTRDVLC